MVLGLQDQGFFIKFLITISYNRSLTALGFRGLGD